MKVIPIPSPRRHCRRRGAVVVLTVVLLIGMIGCLAFALDLGFVFNARTEMQRSADAAALAATWRLLEDQIATHEQITKEDATDNARTVAEQFAGLNPVSTQSPDLAENDVRVGHYLQGSGTVDPDSTLYTNTVQVRVQRTEEQNGQIRLFFARVLGFDELGMQCSATAAFWSGFSGFQLPEDGSNLGMLPITLDRETYDAEFVTFLQNGTVGEDNFAYNPETGEVTQGSDGIPEVNLYPQGTGAPGNRGTVDFGNPNNTTPDLQRQILDGLNAEDLSYLGGSIQFDENGELILNGDTGISAAIKSSLETIKGEPRMIPIFDSVAGTGNNANYTITAFTGIRILKVKLTGSMATKVVIIQPAPMQTRGGIRDDDGSNRTTFIYSPVVLVK
jgi:Flp pilus assembly protein TadG